MPFGGFQILRTAIDQSKSGATFFFCHEACVESNINEQLKYFSIWYMLWFLEPFTLAEFFYLIDLCIFKGIVYIHLYET